MVLGLKSQSGKGIRYNYYIYISRYIDIIFGVCYNRINKGTYNLWVGVPLPKGSDGIEGSGPQKAVPAKS
jgi:hypothetical protein